MVKGVLVVTDKNMTQELIGGFLRSKIFTLRVKKMKYLFLGLFFVASFSASAVPFDYLVFEWNDSEGLSLYSQQEVDLPLSQTLIQKPNSGSYVAVENATGEVRQVIYLTSHRVQMSEHHGFNHISDSSFENGRYECRTHLACQALKCLQQKRNSFSESSDITAT